MLNRIKATDDLQNKMKIKDSNLCTFCEQQPETLEHWFAECRYSNQPWEEIQRYLADQGLRPAGSDFSKQEKLLGSTECDILTNQLLILTRKHIFFRKCKEMKPSFRDWKQYVKTIRDTERFAAVITLELHKFDSKWDRLGQT